MDIHSIKVDIGSEKVDIHPEKVDIESKITRKCELLSPKTANHVRVLFEKYGQSLPFGRSDVISLLGMSQSGASKLLANLLLENIIFPVRGLGKGKYKFGISD